MIKQQEEPQEDKIIHEHHKEDVMFTPGSPADSAQNIVLNPVLEPVKEESVEDDSAFRQEPIQDESIVRQPLRNESTLAQTPQKPEPAPSPRVEIIPMRTIGESMESADID